MATEKSEIKTVRWTPDQWEHVEDLAEDAGSTPSAYIRETVTGQRPRRRSKAGDEKTVRVLTDLAEFVKATANRMEYPGKVNLILRVIEKKIREI